jgi:hypothetical protein
LRRAPSSSIRIFIRRLVRPSQWWVSQICTDLTNYKAILETLFLRNLWIINADLTAGRKHRISQNWEKIFIVRAVKSQDTKRGLDSPWMNCY